MQDDQIRPGPPDRVDRSDRLFRAPFGTFRYDALTGQMSLTDAFSAILGFVGGDIVPSLGVVAAHEYPDDGALLGGDGGIGLARLGSDRGMAVCLDCG